MLPPHVDYFPEFKSHTCKRSSNGGLEVTMFPVKIHVIKPPFSLRVGLHFFPTTEVPSGGLLETYFSLGSIEGMTNKNLWCVCEWNGYIGFCGVSYVYTSNRSHIESGKR